MLMWPLVVEVGDRIAQLILERIVNPDVMEVQVSLQILVRKASLTPMQDLDETLRGAGGFGSTGGHTGLAA